MRALHPIVLLTLLVANMVVAPPARPCSIAVNLMGGLVDGATVGPNPVLFGIHPPSVARADDPTVIIAFVPAPELGVVMIQGQAGQGFRPAEPLAAGEYEVHNALTLSQGLVGPGARLFVDPELVEDPPEVPSVDLRLIVTEPEDASGCTFDRDSCSDIDFTKLEVVRAADREGDQILLTVTNPRTGEQRSAVFGSRLPGPHQVNLFEDANGGLIPGSLKKDRLCYTATPISEAGTLGAELDLGCIRPTDNDPRTDDLRGCAAAPLGLQHLGLWLCALVLGRVHLSRRPRAAR